MKVENRDSPSEVHSDIRNRIVSDVSASLESIVTQGDQFVVNDTLWHAIQGQQVTPTVVNSAKYITGHFKEHLDQQADWETEKKISGQTIDGYIELPTPNAFQISKEGLLTIISNLWEGDEVDADELFSQLYQRYYKRKSFLVTEKLSEYADLFTEVLEPSIVRIGLEFETGNIASSFRAFSKLSSLFRQNEIDAGIFITSKDKDTTACVIWPQSNRNGSFVELESRDYKRNISLPLYEFSFAPDSTDQNAPYLAEDKTLYTPQATDEIRAWNKIDYRAYEVRCGNHQRAIYKPLTP